MSVHAAMKLQLRRRIALVLWVRSFLGVLSAWLVFWGLTILIARTVGANLNGLLWLGLTGAIASLVGSFYLSRRQFPSDESLTAMLDKHWDCHGLLMAKSELSDKNWTLPTKGTLKTPTLSWKYGKQLGILSCCLTFLVASFLVPTNFASKATAGRLKVDAEVQDLAQKIQVLKEESVLTEQRAQQLEQSLEELERDAVGNDPAKTWEAMTHLESSVSKAVQEAFEKSSKVAKESAAGEELAEALDGAKQSMDSDALKQAMNQLGQDLKKMAAKTAMLNSTLSEELLKQLSEGKLSPDQLQELAKQLGNLKEGELRKLEKLAKAKMIDPKRLKELAEQCKGDPKGLCEKLGQCKGGNAMAALLAQCNSPGRGGISRGGGAAELTWQSPVGRENVEFKEKVLEPGAALSLKDSRLEGLSMQAPSSENVSQETSGGSLNPSANAGGGSARTQVILPEHKKAVQRYFDRGSKDHSSSVNQ